MLAASPSTHGMRPVCCIKPSASRRANGIRPRKKSAAGTVIPLALSPNASQQELVAELIKVAQSGDKNSLIDVFERVRANGDVPKSAAALEDRFSGAWGVVDATTASAEAVTSGMSLAVLSFGMFPPIPISMKSSLVNVQSGEYQLMHVCAPQSEEAPSQTGQGVDADSAAFAVVLSGLVDFEGAPTLQVAFKQFTVAPLCGEGGSPLPESAAAVATVASKAGMATDGQGRLVVPLPAPMADKAHSITVIHNDGNVHAHEGFMKYVLQRVEFAPECVIPKLHA